MITLSIDVNKIDKSRFFTRKNGARMLDLVLIETPNSKYDTDYMVVQSVSKEEKAAGVKLPILGNAKIIETKGNRSQPSQQGGEKEDW